MVFASRCHIILIIIILIGVQSCTPPDREPPHLEISVAPPIGDSLTVFYFNPSVISDNSTPAWQIEVRWDFNNDQIWDTDYSIYKEQTWRFQGNGDYQVTCQALDEAGNTSLATTAVKVMPCLRDTQFVDSRDGRTYQAALLFDRWWMSGNLMYGKALQTDQSAHDDDYTDYYYLKDTLIYGGYYTWGEATFYGRDVANGICPSGWRLPVPADLEGLNEICSVGDQAESYLFTSGPLKTSFLFSGLYITSSQVWLDQSEKMAFWLNNQPDPDKNQYLMLWDTQKKNAGFRNFYMGNPSYAKEIGWINDWGGFDYRKLALPVRCVKDISR